MRIFQIKNKFYAEFNASYLLIVFAMSACGSGKTVESNKVSEDTIYESHSSTYDASTGELTHFSRFKDVGVRGDSILLTSPAEVTVNDLEMRNLDGMDTALLGLILPMPFLAFAFSGPFYVQDEKRSDISKANIFVFKTNSGKLKKHSISINKPAEVSSPEDAKSHSIGKDLIVEIKAEKLEKDEDVYCSLVSESKEAGKTKVLVERAEGKDLTCKFEQKDLENFATGTAKLQVKRSLMTKIEGKEGRGYLSPGNKNAAKNPD